MWVFALAAYLMVGVSNGQSNYDKQAISISYEKPEGDDGTGLPQYGTLNGTVTELNDISSTILLNKTKADLNCSAGFMSIKMEFQNPFYGIVYADFDRNRYNTQRLSPHILWCGHGGTAHFDIADLCFESPIK